MLESKNFQAEAKLVILEPLELVVYPSDESFAPNFWNKYNVNQWSRKLSGGVIVEDYGVSYWNSETHKLDYYIGIRKEVAKGDLTNAVTL